MTARSPAALLDNPEAAAEAPWCSTLDNLELGILILAVPWASAAGLRRAELERQLERLDLPLGPLYFQRVKRAVARLEDIGALSASGEGRSRRFETTPEGFAALLLNLCVLRADPTLDGSELELKRTVVGLLNHLLEQVAELPEGEPLLSPPMERFFAAVEELTVFGQPVISDDIEDKALDVLRLIAEQRRQVERLLNQLSPTCDPWLGPAAHALRYEHFLRYLDELASLYTAKLKTVGLDAARSFLAARRAG
jgi:hypothetical protein